MYISIFNELVFTNTSSGDYISVSWDFGNGSPVVTGDSVIYTYPNPGSYTVTQTVEYNNEMTSRLGVPYDVLSDEKLELKNALNLPIFSINNKDYLKRLTLIIENNIIKKVFYPIYPIDKHIEDILKWLKEN